MTTSALVAIIVPFLVAFSAATFYGMQFYQERVPWSAAAKSVRAFADIIVGGVPRLPGERLKDWEERVVAAHHELHEASHAFIEAAAREGTVEHHGQRSSTWMLPANHPASIRLARARGGRVEIVRGTQPYRTLDTVEIR